MKWRSAIVVLVLLAPAVGQKQTKPPNVTTCVPTPPRGPSLMVADKAGKCATGYTGKKDGKKTMYCVNTKRQTAPVVCKTGPYAPPKASPPPKKK